MWAAPRRWWSDLVAALAGTGAVFVGSHPLCGSEQQGIDAARADLYEDALVFVSAPPRAAARAVPAVSRFWKQVGARVVACPAREHDRLVARTSHLPHMVASLLAVTVARSEANKLGRFCGSGFADTSRVAEGSPDVWHDIVLTNRGNLANELRAYTRQTERLIGLLDDGDFRGVQRFLEQGQAARRLLLKGKPRKDV
jgi:prephenate dehydrogenase